MEMIKLPEVRVSDFTQKIGDILPVTNRQNDPTDYQHTIIRCGVTVVGWVEVMI